MSTLPLPLFTFLLKDGSGAVFLRHGTELFMPIFTSEERAQLYKNRGQLDCLLHVLKSLKEVKAFIKQPKSRAPGVSVDFCLVIDPDPNPGTLKLLRRQQVLQAIKA